MAAIGMYGVFYSKCVKDENGIVTGYTGGVKQMGKAIDAGFTPTEADDNPLYANNSVAENDSSAAAGGEITMTLDRLTEDVYVDIYGLQRQEVTVKVHGQEVKGNGVVSIGNENSVPVGVAYIRSHQINNNRSYHEVVAYREVTFSAPEENAQTRGESIEWQTPEITGNVAGLDDNQNPWKVNLTFPTQEAAMQYIREFLAESKEMDTKVVSLASQTEATGIGEKQALDLMANGIKLMADGSVVGTLHYVTEWAEAGEKLGATEGNFCFIQLPKDATKMDCLHNGQYIPGKTNVDLQEDKKYIFLVASEDDTYGFDITYGEGKKESVTLNFNRATLEAKAG